MIADHDPLAGQPETCQSIISESGFQARATPGVRISDSESSAATGVAGARAAQSSETLYILNAQPLQRLTSRARARQLHSGHTVTRKRRTSTSLQLETGLRVRSGAAAGWPGLVPADPARRYRPGGQAAVGPGPGYDARLT